MHQANALDGSILLKFTLEFALSHVIRQAGHKEGLERIALHSGKGARGTYQAHITGATHGREEHASAQQVDVSGAVPE
jgi:hypothetical protein